MSIDQEYTIAGFVASLENSSAYENFNTSTAPATCGSSNGSSPTVNIAMDIESVKRINSFCLVSKYYSDLVFD